MLTLVEPLRSFAEACGPPPLRPQDLPKIKVPLILGIWGGKGQGKTFQVSGCGWPATTPTTPCDHKCMLLVP